MSDFDVRVFNLLKKLKIVFVTKIILSIKDVGLIKTIKKSFDKLKNKKCSNNQEINDINDKINIGNITKYVNNKVVIDVVYDSRIDIENLKKIFNEIIKEKNILCNYIMLVDKYDENKIKQINFEKLKDLFYDRAFILITKNDKLSIEEFYYCKKIIYNDKLKDEIKQYLNSLSGLKIFANYNNMNCVSVKSGTFLGYEGTNYYSGGAERYLIDLYDIFKKRNINLDIYQNATKPFFRKYNNINVIGMSLKGLPLYLDDNYIDKQTKHYNNLTVGKSQLHIYSAFFECFPNCATPSVGISHGIGWDNESNKNLDVQSFWQGKKSIIEGAKECDYLISVDTNTANWFQTIDYDIGNRKFSVIPNYVDTKDFSPREDFTKLRDKIIIVYPRRLYKPRGLYMVLECIDKILQEYKNVEFHFVGKGFKQEVDDIDKYVKKYPSQVKRYNKSPFEMSEVYKNADISLIPTLYSEGTSLSCLEALASGNVVISTRVGGLSDLVIDGYNGYLIEPNAKALLNALEYVISNYDKQSIIKSRAVEVAKAFNKSIWQEKWNHELDKMNLKKVSSNIGLVEFYVKDIEKINNNIINLIKKELLLNNLVYIRSKKEKEIDDISCGLIQLVNFDDEIVSEANKVYVEKGIEKEIKRKEKIIII